MRARNASAGSGTHSNMQLALVTAALCLVPLAANATQETPKQTFSLTSYVQPGPIAWPEPQAAKVEETSTPVLKDVPLPTPRPDQIGQAALDPDAAPQYSHEKVCETLVAAARKRDLPVAFFARLIWQESKFKPSAVSPVGAAGIAQFMPETARGMELSNPFDALQALPASAELLETLKRRFGNIGLAAAAYNSTPKRIADWLRNKAKLPDETKKYVLNITGRPAESWKAAKLQGPLPQLPSQVPCNKVEEFVAVEQAERREHERVQERIIAERADAVRTRVAVKVARKGKVKTQVAELTARKKTAQPVRVAEKAKPIKLAQNKAAPKSAKPLKTLKIKVASSK